MAPIRSSTQPTRSAGDSLAFVPTRLPGSWVRGSSVAAAPLAPLVTPLPSPGLGGRRIGGGSSF